MKDYQPIISYGKSIQDIVELTPFEALEEIKKYSKVVANSEEIKIIEEALKEWLINKEFITKLKAELWKLKLEKQGKEEENGN